MFFVFKGWLLRGVMLVVMLFAITGQTWGENDACKCACANAGMVGVANKIVDIIDKIVDKVLSLFPLMLGLFGGSLATRIAGNGVSYFRGRNGREGEENEGNDESDCEDEGEDDVNGQGDLSVV